MIRLVSAQCRVNLHEDQLGDIQPKFAADLTRDQFSYQSQRPLPGAAKLYDVHPKIVRGNDRRKAAALAQRRYVLRRYDHPELHALKCKGGLASRADRRKDRAEARSFLERRLAD